MKKPQYRTRQFSSQNHKRSSKQQQYLESRCTPIEKQKNTSRLYMQKQLSLYIKPPPSISSSSWLLLNSKNNQYLGFREGQQREVASLTKIMTTLLTLNLIEKYGLDKQIAIRVSRSSSLINGTSAQIRHGKWMKLEDLLYGTMLPSGNDAAFLLSEVMGLLLFYERMKPQDKQYSDIESIDITLYQNTGPFITRFIKEMNKLAKQLRLFKTSFANPHGLTNSLNLSTAQDMLELSKHASEKKEFMKIVNSEKYSCQIYNDDLDDVFETMIWENTNKLLKKGWEGIKTGQTPAAGSCLSSLREGIYIVVLNCCNNQARFLETEAIFDWYSRYYGPENQLVFKDK